MSGGSKKQTTNTEQKVEIPDYMKPYMGGALKDASSLYASGGFAPQRTRSSETLKSNQMALDLADYLQGTAIPGYEQSINDLRNKSVVNSDVTRNAIDAASRPVLNQLNRYAIPATQDAAIVAGQRGSSRQGIAEGLARSDANNQMLDAGARISTAAMGEELTNQRLATQLMPQLLQMMGLPAQLVGGVGQANDEFAFNNANSQSQNLLQYANLLKMFTPQMNQTQNSTVEQKTGSSLGNILSAAGGIASLIGTGGMSGLLNMGGLGTALGGIGGALTGGQK